MVSSPGLQSEKNKVWVPKGKASPFHDGPRNDQLLAMVMALTVEVSILRERLDTHERISEEDGGFGIKDVEIFDPDTKAQGERSSLRNRIMHKVFRVLQAEPKKQ